MPQEVDKAEPLPTVKLAVNGALEISEGSVRLFLSPAPGAKLEPISEDKLKMLMHFAGKLSGRFTEMTRSTNYFPELLDRTFPGYYAALHMLPHEGESQCVFHLTAHVHAAITAGIADIELARTVGLFRPLVSREVATFERRASMLRGREVLVNFAGISDVDASETGGYSVA